MAGGKKAVDPNMLSEVDKTFYELTITDLNRKLARLKTLSSELEQQNEELKAQLAQLDEDRKDVITYLKRQLTEKSEEFVELQERLTALEETRESEIVEFQRKITQKDQDYRLMHEQLTSEIKLMTGKLNSLEEFRMQRDDLMRKFDVQAGLLEEQQVRQKRELYETEKKFIIAKDKLKKEMEARLMQLSTEFQEVTEVRIASTTHRVIRENIAMNNELDSMLSTHRRLFNENEKLKDSNRTLKYEAQLHEQEKKKVISKAKVQLNLIDRLTTEHEKMTNEVEVYKDYKLKTEIANSKIDQLKVEIEKHKVSIRILEQNLHASRCERANIKAELDLIKDEVNHLRGVVFNSVKSIKEVIDIKVKPKARDRVKLVAKREKLLSNLYQLLCEAKSIKARQPSAESVDSVSAMYARGDLGFVPKRVVHRSKVPTLRHIDAQVGPSLERLAAMWVPPAPAKHKKKEGDESSSEEEEEPEEPELLHEREQISQVLFGSPSVVVESLPSSEASIVEEQTMVTGGYEMGEGEEGEEATIVEEATETGPATDTAETASSTAEGPSEPAEQDTEQPTEDTPSFAESEAPEEQPEE